MSDFSINGQNVSSGMFKKQGIDGDSLAKNGGLFKTDNMSVKHQALFKALDKNNDGVIDSGEFGNFINNSDGAAGTTKDGKLNAKEAKNFFKNNEATKDISLSNKDILEFLELYSNDGSPQDIASAVKSLKNGKEIVTVSYNNGQKMILNNTDKTLTTIDGNEFVEKKDDGTLIRRTLTTETSEVTTEYSHDGKSISTVTEKDLNTGKTIISEYDNSQVVARDEIQGHNKKHYQMNPDTGNLELVSSVMNEGHPVLEKRTTYKYDGDTVTEETHEPGKTTVTIKKGGVTESYKITEGTRTEEMTRNSADGSYVVVVKDSADNSSSETKYNSDNHAISQNMTKGGKEYSVQYDGKGNTKITVQMGESIGVLTKKFGITKEQLLEANGGKFRGWAGDEVVIPGELSADDTRLQNRKDAKAVQAQYKAYMEEQKGKNIKIEDGKYSEMAKLFENEDTVAAGIKYLTPNNLYAVFSQYNRANENNSDPKKRNIISVIMNNPKLSQKEKNDALNQIRSSAETLLKYKHKENPHGRYKPISDNDLKEWYSAIKYSRENPNDNYERVNNVLKGLLNPVSDQQIQNSKMKLTHNNDYYSPRGYGNIGDINTFAQATTGNCMAIDTLQSFVNAPGGREYINSLIQKPTEDNPQIITVRLYDKNKNLQYYDVKVSDIENASRKRTVGDKNAIVLELAMQQCLERDYGADISSYQNADIGMRMLTGGSKKVNVADIEKFATGKMNKSIVLVPKKGAEKCNVEPRIIPEHGYMVKRFVKDKNGNLCAEIRHPWMHDNEQFLTMDKFKEIFGEMYVRDIPKPIEGDFV